MVTPCACGFISLQAVFYRQLKIDKLRAESLNTWMMVTDPNTNDWKSGLTGTSRPEIG